MSRKMGEIIGGMVRYARELIADRRRRTAHLRMAHYTRELLVVALVVCVVGGLLRGLMVVPSPQEVEMAGYATSLVGRTSGQRHNARLAAAALNGKLIAPSAVFSYNATVKSWSQDQGYVKAPVSYDGELVKAYGGGVCQTSTTLYNAALLAGLPILERHPHVFAPHYVPPGRDAAVAYPNIDLQFRNPYPWPIRLRATTEADHLEVRILGAHPAPQSVDIETEILSVSNPARRTRVVTRSADYPRRAYVRNPGAVGYRVVSYRTFSGSTKEADRRERLGDDSYQAMDRIVQLDETAASPTR